MSVKAALKTLRAKDRDYPEIVAACRLIAERGSEDQFREYLHILQEMKVRDTERYGQLWQVAWEHRSARMIRVLAVLLDAERRTSAWNDVRYCDFAGALLQKFSVENFGFKEWDKMTLQQRDAAVARARDWMRRHDQDPK